MTSDPASTSPIPAEQSRFSLRLLRPIVWALAVLSGFAQAWASRYFISPDGNNYLDIASAYLHADWKTAINAYWSPLFSWLLAIVLGTVRPNSYWESTVIHLTNLLAFLIGLRCFEFFFSALLRSLKREESCNEDGSFEFPLWLLGYGFFFSSSLFMVSLASTTPDIWVCIFTYLGAGLILQIVESQRNTKSFPLLGGVLGLAYLAKSFYFPMGVLFLLIAWACVRRRRGVVLRVAFAVLVFLAVAGPFVFVISRAKHRFTFGDVGRIAYAESVDQLAQPFFWKGENHTGIPAHPTRELLAAPRVYEFATPVGGTYPPAFDMSYWMEGVHPYFSLRGQLRVFRQSFGTFYALLSTHIEYLVALLGLSFLVGSWHRFLGICLRLWPVWLPAVVACLAYSAVLVEGRYVASFLLLAWLVLLSSAISSLPKDAAHTVLSIALAVVCVTGLRIVKSTVTDLASAASQRNVDWEVAQRLQQLGLKPGDRISGLSGIAEAHWARLAGVKIVSQIPLGAEAAFWTASPALRNQVLQTLASTGAQLVVTQDPPPCAIDMGWLPLGDTGYFFYRLAAPSLNTIASP